MEYSVQKLSKSAVEIAVSVEKEEWNACIQEAYKKNKHQFKVEGFRPGKVPFNVLAKRYGLEIFFEDAMDIALNKYYGEILDKEKEIEPVGRPELDVQETSEDGLKVVIKTAIYPKFEVAAYKERKIAKENAEVPEEEIDAEIEKRRENACRWLDVTDREVQNGDRIILDYSGSVDGVKFDGGTAEGQSLDIGSGMFIPGFEEQTIGMKVGENKDITVTFPKDYGAENLAGKDAVFNITVHEIKVKELPVLDDEFAKDISEFDTLDELKNSIRNEKKENAERRAAYAEDDKLIDAITADTEIEIPEVMVEEELDRILDDLKMRMQYSGLKFEDYLKYLGTTEKGIRDERRADAEKSVKTRLVLEAIIAAEKLSVTKEELDEELAKLAEKDGKTKEEAMKGLNEYDVGRMVNTLTADKLFKYLRSVNTIE